MADGSVADKKTVKAAPRPRVDSSSMCPPWAWVKRRASARPSPVPGLVLWLLLLLLCSKSSKIRRWSAGSIPGPVSVTVSAMSGPALRALTVTRPAEGVNFKAFDSRLMRI